MAYKKTLSIRLLSFVLVFILLFMHVMAVNAEELYDDYSGTFSFTNNIQLCYLNFVTNIIDDPQTTSQGLTSATYKGSTQHVLRFSQVEGYVYIGQATATVTYVHEDLNANMYNMTTSDIVSHEYQLPDGINVVMEYVNRNTNLTRVRYRIIFNNYQASYSGYAYLSWIADITCGIRYSKPAYEPSIVYQVTSELDYTEALFQYENFVDVPSYEGENNKQNEQIIQEQQKSNELQQEANDLQKEANETSKGILGKISDFFGGFFTNLGNTVLSWIVPTSEQLSDFLGEVNSWFSDRLGFVWYPFDLAIQLVNALAGGSADSTITIPALSLNMLGASYQIWNSIKIDIDAFGIFQYVRYFTDALLVAGVAKLAFDKWDEWIGGHGVG